MINLKEEILKIRFNCRLCGNGYDLKDIVELFKKWALECVGEDRKADEFEEWDVRDADVSNLTKQEVRQRIQESIGGENNENSTKGKQ